MDAAFFHQLITRDGPLLEGFALVLLALLLARLAPLPQHWDPLQGLSWLAKRMAVKVCHPERSAIQQLTAGILALLLLILPFWAVVSFIPLLAEFPWFFHLVMLYLCFNDQQVLHRGRNIVLSMQMQDLSRARQQLSPMSLTETDKLSATGISKTTIESLLTIPVSGLIAPLLFYTLIGPAAALLVRMINQLALSWPTDYPPYRYFAAPVHRVNNLLMLLPGRIWQCLLAFQGPISGYYHPFALRRDLHYRLGLLQLGSRLLQRELGGPVQYARQRLQRPKTGPAVMPTTADINRMLHLCHTGYLICGSFLLLLPLIKITFAP
ncbi:cobalamin biosynthesis protein CbiB [Shewanella sp. NFH-SH190041]|uniref:cobalamin biosynthesis protein n=1 Tax=Shewanella sp. NFH-SH190041 TaxID=2950245 RepID=UPI0021C3EB16|nr:cobalamin biosynthesis protein [Shewanella sp. NFH-SH190041]BDM63602.1 cobalamin biosynthesis protein CbiB [Shewanella sp. NFH-SH190041]